MNAVLSPCALATLNTSTAHSAVISGSLYDDPSNLAPCRRASRTKPSGAYEAAVAAGEAGHGVALEPFHQLARARPRVQRLGEARGPAVGGVVGEEGDDAAVSHGRPSDRNIPRGRASAECRARAGRAAARKRCPAARGPGPWYSRT